LVAMQTGIAYSSLIALNFRGASYSARPQR
jgi:hypothetical protein